MWTLVMNTALTGMNAQHDPADAPAPPPPPAEFAFDEDDWLRCDPIYRTKLEKFRLMFWSGFATLVALGLLFEYTPWARGFLEAILVPLLVAGAVGLLFLFTVVAGIVRRARRDSLRAAEARGVLGSWKVAVSDDGVLFHSPAGERRTRWGDLAEVHDLNTVVAFFAVVPPDGDASLSSSPRDRFVGAIPRGAFASRDAREAFIDYTQKRLTTAEVPIRSFE